MSILINIILMVVVVRRIYWFNKYGTIRKKEVKALKKAMKRRSNGAATFYLPTAKQMVEELYPNAPMLDNRDLETIVSFFVLKKDVKVPDVKIWDEVIGDYLLKKERLEAN